MEDATIHDESVDAARSDYGEESGMKSVRRPDATKSLTQGVQSSVAHYWWVVLIAVIAGLISTVYFAERQPPVFRASATLVLVPVAELADTRAIVDSLNTLDRRSVVATLAMVPASRRVKELARAELRLTEAQIQPYSVKTAVVPDTNTIEVTVEGPRPRFVAAFAYALAEQSIFSARDYYNIYTMKVLDSPVVPTKDVGPSLVRKLIAGIFFGLLIGVGAAMLLSYASARRFDFMRQTSWQNGRKRKADQRDLANVITDVDSSDEPEHAVLAEDHDGTA